VNLTLNPGVNYLWITYDVKNTAATGDCLAAPFDSLFINDATDWLPVYDNTGITCLEVGNPQVSGLVGLSASEIKLLPNPSNGILNIENIATLNDGFTIKIVDCLGNIVFQNSDKSTIQKSYDLSFLANGIYMVQITTADKYYFSKWFKE
jgi:hypothetical protein